MQGGREPGQPVQPDWRWRSESNRRIRVLQTRALPLGYATKLTPGVNGHAKPVTLG